MLISASDNLKTRTTSKKSRSLEVETGSFASHENLSSDYSKLVVATFNIRYAVGSFLITGSILRRIGIKRPKRRGKLVERHLQVAARALRSNRIMPAPDIIALQEADKGTRRAGEHNIAREFARLLSMNYAQTMMDFPRDAPVAARKWWLDFEERIRPDDPGSMGVALLSRTPLIEAQRIDLPYFECAWRPRIAIRARVPFADRELHIFNSHIDTHATIANQLAQHMAVLDLADNESSDTPIIITGDFNTLTNESCTQMRCLLEARGYTTPFPNNTATWRAGFVRLHTDWIFMRNLRALRWGVARPLGVSDHWPVWVEVAN
ncbi:MAG: endonuclease/exonuclease/phosphatase family protein [Pyrinomonadaceae bacterium]|nr:endonuclease/exonuclease/phosphatase family protein [Pyrinomonadaceae bacterium]